jgi:hypothetical protein
MRLCLFPVLLVTLALMAGCREAKIENYRVPHETPDPLPPILTGEAPSAQPSPGAPADMASTAVPTASGNALVWKAPESWKAKPASAMRKGSYTIPGDGGADGDLSITAFPGDVGGLLANVNRWRGQIELPPLSENELGTAVSHIDRNGLHMDVVDFSNPAAAKPQRILGALVAFNGATWFFKLMGPESVVGHEKAAFMQFLETVQPPSPVTR